MKHAIHGLCAAAGLFASLSGSAVAQTQAPWADDFESYPVGIDPTNPSVGGWTTWPFFSGTGARISTTFASSGLKSLFNGGTSDVLQLFNVTSGQWTMSSKVFVPSSGPEAMTVPTWFIMLHRYSANGPKDWAMQLSFDPWTGNATWCGPNKGTTMPYVPDKWIDIDVQIDLDADRAACFIDRVQFGSSWQWTQGTGPSSFPPRIQALDLWSNLQNMGSNPKGGASYDDFWLRSGFGFTSFCTPKTTLVCGPATVRAVGFSSVSATSGFRVYAAPTRGCRLGLALYTNQPPVPGVTFGGPGDGLLCLPALGLLRAGPIDSGGSSAQACDGVMAIDMNSFATFQWSASGCSAPPGQNQPAGFLTNPGLPVRLQIWGRDSTSTGEVLSDGLAFMTAP